jgi:hypothetical protein
MRGVSPSTPTLLKKFMGVLRKSQPGAGVRSARASANRKPKECPHSEDSVVFELHGVKTAVAPENAPGLHAAVANANGWS